MLGLRMSWLSRLLPSRSETSSLDAASREALVQWSTLAAPDLTQTHFETRYVVLNTEASGLDLEKDRLLSVGAIALDSGTLAAAESYYALLEPDPGSVMTNLLTFSGSGPIVVFNAGLNRILLERAFDTHVGLTPDWTWLDLHWLLPALFDEPLNARTRLADWMDMFDIETFQRHHALGDAYAIAQLMLAAEARALKRGLVSVRHLVDLERTRRQLSTR